MCLLKPRVDFFGVTLGLEQVVNTFTKDKISQRILKLPP